MVDILSILGLSSMGGGLVASKLIDYLVPFSRTPQGKLFKEQKAWQNELEEKRMSFQEQLEARRLRCQEHIERQRAELQTYLAEKGMANNREIALFQARAMRQTQMLVAQENARNVLHDHLLQDALRTFPLNVSPLVLLKNQSQSLGYLLSFSEPRGERDISVAQVYEEVEESRRHPEALNIFIAPVHIDSRIRNRKILSDQIWDTVYQRIESFFTLNYSRTGDHPVIFYPTAWNDKYNPGMHASETLHYFLKDLPCVVIEPRFDGNTFRMMFSSWGIGYNSTVHHRTELSFPVNIDAALAYAVYERSRKALDAIEEIDGLLDINQYGFRQMKEQLSRNIDLFQALHIEDRMKENRMAEIDALGIYNIFKIEPTQDLVSLADYLSSRIGLNLAVLADIHHLRSIDVEPLFPKLFKQYFPALYAQKELRLQVAEEYKRSYRWLKNEENDLQAIGDVRDAQMLRLETRLELTREEEAQKTTEELLRTYAKDNMGLKKTSVSFEELLDWARNHMESKDIPFFTNWVKNVDNPKVSRKINGKILDLEQHVKQR